MYIYILYVIGYMLLLVEMIFIVEKDKKKVNRNDFCVDIECLSISRFPMEFCIVVFLYSLWLNFLLLSLYYCVFSYISKYLVDLFFCLSIL